MQFEAPAHWVRGCTFLFRLVGERLESVPLPYSVALDLKSGQPRLKDPAAWARGDYWADVAVEVDLYRAADGRVFCGAVDVRTLPGGPRRTETASELTALNHLGPDVTAELTARLWRQIPIGTLIDMTLQELRGDADRYAGRLPDEVVEMYRKNAAGTPTKSKPGPKPLLPPEVLAQVVAPAYLAGGRRPVVAVQEALAASGHNNGHVTLDMARKAVARARRLNFIPPARRRAR